MRARSHTSSLPTLLFSLAALALTPGCDRASDADQASPAPKADAPAADAPKADAPKAPTAAKAPPEQGGSGVSLTFARAPLTFYEQGKLKLRIDAEGKVTDDRGKPMGVFGADGIYTNSKGEFGMQYMADGTLLRNDKTPFFGRLDAEGNYVTKAGKWSFRPDGTFLINGMDMAKARLEGVTPQTYAFAMAVMVAIVHPAAESIVR